MRFSNGWLFAAVFTLLAVVAVRADPRPRSAGNAANFDGFNDILQVTPNCGASVGFDNTEGTLMGWVNIINLDGNSVD